VPPDAVIDRQVSRQPGVSLLDVLERHRIKPFLAEGLDEPLGLAFMRCVLGLVQMCMSLRTLQGLANALDM